MDCLKIADTDWLTNILKFVRRRLESTVERCFIMAIFSPVTMIIFIPSSFFLGCTSYIVHVFK